mmetsp:Transcript_25874/g.80721  ORF Transcript_25874/g.80721 Transcript_25874/m.80721 type:complete len:267 (+) Transcript_25874:40-840(+)
MAVKPLRMPVAAGSPVVRPFDPNRHAAGLTLAGGSRAGGRPAKSAAGQRWLQTRGRDPAGIISITTSLILRAALEVGAAGQAASARARCAARRGQIRRPLPGACRGALLAPAASGSAGALFEDDGAGACASESMAETKAAAAEGPEDHPVSQGEGEGRGSADDGSPGLLLCAQCGSEMASMAACEGSKVQPNPGGMPLYISKFSSAAGAEAAGDANAEDSFFPGWAWRMASCRSCGAHVGWSYESRGKPPFWGLLMHRLEKNESAL